MNISAPFIRRPVGTSLLTIALLLSGALAFRFLPVAPLPQVEFPVISVGAGLPGASPETMASSVATPLERQFGRISGVNQMTSTSQLGSTNIVLQFDLSRNIDAAARDVQAAINAARGQLPANLPSNPNYRKVNPADAPILILSMTSDTIRLPEIYDAAEFHPGAETRAGFWRRPGFRRRRRESGGARRIEPNAAEQAWSQHYTGRKRTFFRQCQQAQGRICRARQCLDYRRQRSAIQGRAVSQPDRFLKQNGVIRLGDVADVQDSVEDLRNAGSSNGKRAVLLVIFRQPGANIISTVDNVRGLIPQLKSCDLAVHQTQRCHGPHSHCACLRP